MERTPMTPWQQRLRRPRPPRTCSPRERQAAARTAWPWAVCGSWPPRPYLDTLHVLRSRSADTPVFFQSTKFFACLDVEEARELFRATRKVGSCVSSCT
jgi:hypothetical protein